ncbi:MAG TPA: hypothetical protein VK581_12460 [Chthoniobacterales bacterium]|nr:hypothetical protein [Chthoniobacterales bacterium]
MVRTPRKKIVIAALALLAASAIAFAAQPIRDAVCFPFLSPPEKKIVGEWQASMLGGLSVTTIHADHRWTSAGGSCFGDGGPYLSGHWRLDGADLIFSFTPGQFGDLPAPSPWRCSVQQLKDDDRQTRLEAHSNPGK